MMRKISADKNKISLIRIDVKMTAVDNILDMHSITKFFQTNDEAICYEGELRRNNPSKSIEIVDENVDALQVDGRWWLINYDQAFQISRLGDTDKYGDLQTVILGKSLQDCGYHFMDVYAYSRRVGNHLSIRSRDYIPSGIEYYYSLSSKVDIDHWHNIEVISEKPILIEITPILVSHVSLSSAPIIICNTYASMARRNNLLAAKDKLEKKCEQLKDELKSTEDELAAVVGELGLNNKDTNGLKMQ